MADPKILFFDTEISLKVGYFYDQWNTNIPHTQIKHGAFMISAAWRWMGERKIHTVSVLDDPKRFKKDRRDDYHVIKTLREQVDKADAIVAHNLKFDLKHLKAGIARHGLHPADAVQICTLQIARSGFNFSGGNSLDNLCQELEVDAQKGKIYMPTWIEAAEGCPKAIKQVVKYNKGDIPTLEGLYSKLKPFVPAKLNMNHFIPEADVCPSCASANLKRNGVQYGRATRKQKWACLDCGHSFVEGKAIETVQMR